MLALRNWKCIIMFKIHFDCVPDDINTLQIFIITLVHIKVFANGKVHLMHVKQYIEHVHA